MSLLAAGTKVSDTLVADRFLGEGAYAEVYRVRHEYLGWQALKLFKRVASLEETRALLDEARLLSTIGHPNIVRLFDANTVRTEEGVRGYFTMEYIPGGSLGRLIAAHRSMVPLDIAVEVIEQIAAGLRVAHENIPPIVHRDLIPANILIGYDGIGMRVRISDFGLAKSTDPITLLASVQGVYAFLAPEALRGAGCSCASDVWSVGALAYLLLTNHVPYSDGAPESTARFHRPLLAPRQFNDDVDDELERIVLAALERDPGNRPANAGLLAEALRQRRQDLVEARTGGAAPGPARRGAGAPGGSGAGNGTGATSSGRVPTEAPSGRARQLADEALTLARRPGALHQAADLMEEAVNLSPRLREAYLPRLTLWRRGVML